MRRIWSVILITGSLLILSSCTSFNLLEPVDPPVGNPRTTPDLVTSLRPTLSWKAADVPDCRYDVVVFEGIVSESFWEGTQRSIGDQVYLREGLKEPRHTIEIALKPGTEYYWSVRIRNDGDVSRWSTYDYTAFLVLSYVRVSEVFFRFKTPG